MILIFKGASTAANRQRTVLRQILKNARYETGNLAAGAGVENGDARNVVRLANGKTVAAETYPVSQNPQQKNRNSGLDVWENEGGSAKKHRDD